MGALTIGVRGGVTGNEVWGSRQMRQRGQLTGVNKQLDL